VVTIIEAALPRLDIDHIGSPPKTAQSAIYHGGLSAHPFMMTAADPRETQRSLCALALEGPMATKRPA
jgi:hypothetical protein